jgi:hypothetical protein
MPKPAPELAFRPYVPDLARQAPAPVATLPGATLPGATLPVPMS